MGYHYSYNFSTLAPPASKSTSRRACSTGKTTCVTIYLVFVIGAAAYAQNADQIFDDALNNVKNTTRIRMRLDPLRLDDMVTQKIVVHDITIRNLLSLERQGPALISSSRQNLTMDAGLAFRNVVVEAKFRLKREPRVLRIRGSVSAILERLVAKIRLYANILAGTVALVYFEVTELGHLRVTNLTGAGALNKLARTLTQRFLIDRNLERIRQVIQKRGREAIEQTLRGTNLSSLL